MEERAVESPLVTKYRRMMAAFNANDLSGVEEFVAEDIRYTIPGKSPLAGTTIGILEHLRALSLAKELSQGTLKLTAAATAVDGDYLFIWGRISAQRAGKMLDCDHGVVFRFADGKVVEGRTLPSNLYEFDDFWS